MRRCAVLTITRNEKHFWPLWHDYYSRFFWPEDIYVLDHDSDDDHLDGYNVRRTLIENGGVLDRPWLRNTVIERYRELQRIYDYVLFCETDEFIAPDPDKFTDLRQYMFLLNKPVVRCTGFEVLHMKHEQPLDTMSKPWLMQRKVWSHNPEFYSKTLLSNNPLIWIDGFHKARDRRCANLEEDPDLYLIHLQLICKELAFKRWLDRPCDADAYRPDMGHIDKLIGDKLYQCNFKIIPPKWRLVL